MVLAAALIAKPGTGPVFVIKTVAIGPATKRAGLVFIGQLGSCEPGKGGKNVRPMASRYF
jgi:hypothetical protein